jgi:homoserine kinase
VEVPASSANLGPGFDSIGMALGVWDECVVTVLADPGLDIRAEGEGSDTVPVDESHLVVRTMRRTWAELGVAAPEGLRLECTNRVPHGRGMGSSATAIVTGIVAAQALCGHDEGGAVVGLFDPTFTNDLAARLEGHPDNASASVFGGATLSWSDDPERGTHTVSLTIHPDVVPVVFAPEIQLSTAKARSVLPAHVRLGDAAANSGRAALLVHALAQDPARLVDATRDWLHQEPRRPSYAESMALVDALRAAEHAAVISGAGPSVLALALAPSVDAVKGFAPQGWRVLTPGTPPTAPGCTPARRPPWGRLPLQSRPIRCPPRSSLARAALAC